MQHLRTEVGELGGLGKRQQRHQERIRDDTWIGGEHPIDVGPDLNLARVEAGPNERSGIVGTTTTERGGVTIGRGSDKAAQDGNATSLERYASRGANGG